MLVTVSVLDVIKKTTSSGYTAPCFRRRVFPRKGASLLQAIFCAHSDKLTQRWIWPSRFLSQNCNSCLYGKHQPSVSLGDFNLKTHLWFSRLRPIDVQMGWDKGCFPLWLLEVVLPLAQYASPLADFGGLQRGPRGMETFASSCGRAGKCSPSNRVFFNAERLIKKSTERNHPSFKKLKYNWFTILC